MSRTLTAADRSRLIRLASTMPVGSPERKAILDGLGKEASSAWSIARTDAEVFERSMLNARKLSNDLLKMIREEPLPQLEGFPGEIGAKAIKARLALVDLAREIDQYDRPRR